MKINDATPQDFEAVQKLYAELTGGRITVSNPDYEAFLARADQHVVLARDDAGEVVGLMAWTVWPAGMSFPQPVCFVQDLVVTEPRRREGFGALLLQHARRWARAQGIRRVHAQTDRYDNDGVIAFYEKNEFRAVTLGVYYIDKA